MISKLSLHCYRNLSGDYSLTDKNLLVAPNGSGKTNLLESIYHLATGQSFKTLASNHELLAENESLARTEISTDTGNRYRAVVSSNDGVLKRQVYINDKVTTQSNISKRLLPILFAPHSVDLVSGDPAGRRADLDIYLSAVLPHYRQSLKSYIKVVKNRNALLKNIRAGFSQPAELEYWNTQLLDLAEQLVSQRLNFFSEIEFSLVNAAKLIYKHQPQLSLRYISKHGETSAEAYIEHLQEKVMTRMALEIESGQTLYGPHKDDYELQLDHKPLRFYGSRGQQRIGIFTLKYAQILFHQANECQSEIIFLIDDLLSELDQEHKENLGHFLMETLETQWILTSADERDIPQELSESNKLNLN